MGGRGLDTGGEFSPDMGIACLLSQRLLCQKRLAKRAAAQLCQFGKAVPRQERLGSC